MKKIWSFIVIICILTLSSFDVIGATQKRVVLSAEIEDIIGGKSISMEHQVEEYDDGVEDEESSISVITPAFITVGASPSHLVSSVNSYIKYTLDGTDPKDGKYYYQSNNLMEYTDDIEITEPGTYKFRAIACINNIMSDEISTEITVEQLDAPEISSMEGDGCEIVTLTADKNADIYYTTDGSKPTTKSELYVSSFKIYDSANVRAIATREGYVASDISTEEIIVKSENESNKSNFETTTDTNDSEYESESKIDSNYDDSESYSDEEDNDDYEEAYDDEEYEDKYTNDNTNYSNNLISSDWAEEEIAEALEYDLIPDIMMSEDLTEVITREKFTAIAVYLYKSLSGDYINFDDTDIFYTPFTDCYYRKSDYIDYISIAYDLGLILGVSNTEFAPDSAISRQDLCVMLGRVVKKCMYDGWSIKNDSKYSFDTSGTRLFDDDDDISDYAKESVYYMAKNDIVLGVDNTHFAPQNITDWQKANGYATSTKEQAIAISLRCCKKFLN